MRIHLRNILPTVIVIFISLHILWGQNSNLDNFSLVGRWELIAINDQPVSSEIYTLGIPYIEFKDKNQIISGFTGCNIIHGQYEITGNMIDFKNIISSKRYCIEIPEQEFLEALEQVETYLLEGTTLYMLSSDTSLLSFKRND